MISSRILLAAGALGATLVSGGCGKKGARDAPEGYEDVVWHLDNLLYEHDTSVVSEKAILLKGRSATPCLVWALRNHEDAGIRTWAETILDRTADPAAAPALAEALADPDSDVKTWAADALITIKNVDVLPQLVEEAMSGDLATAWVAAHVVDALVEDVDFGTDRAGLSAPFVLTSREEPNGRRRTMTRAAWGELDAPLALARKKIAAWWAGQKQGQLGQIGKTATPNPSHGSDAATQSKETE